MKPVPNSRAWAHQGPFDSPAWTSPPRFLGRWSPERWFPAGVVWLRLTVVNLLLLAGSARAALPAIDPGDTNVTVLSTGGIDPLILLTRNLVVDPNWTQAWVQFAFGFGTDEAGGEGEIIDSLTTALTDGISGRSATLFAVDARGISWIPPSAHGVVLPEGDVLRQSIAFPDSAAGFAVRTAHALVVRIPDAMLRGSLTLQSALFDYPNGVNSVALCSAVEVTNDPSTLPLPPWIVAEPQNQLASLGGQARFDATAIGGAPIHYQWWRHTSPIPAGTNATLVLSNLSAAQAGEYSVVAQNSYGAVTSVVATLTLGAPAIFVQQPQSQAVFEGGTVSLSSAVTGNGPFQYQWHFGDAPIAGATAATLTLSNLTLGNLGDYSVIVTSPFGAVTSAIARLTLMMTPQLRISKAGTDVVLTWPAWASRFTLESANLGPLDPWTAVTNVPGPMGEDYGVVLPPSHSQRFFRLYPPVPLAP